MIVALKPGVTQESREQLMDWLQNLGLHIHVSEGEYQSQNGLVLALGQSGTPVR